MGYYINETSKGEGLEAKGKAKALLNDGATLTDATFKENLVCVVESASFDAAGYCYSEAEFDVFNETDDGRPKIWLVHPQAKELAK